MQQQAESSVPSEFRAALRQGMAELASKVKAARERVRDEETALHLMDLLLELERGSCFAPARHLLRSTTGSNRPIPAFRIYSQNFPTGH